MSSDTCAVPKDMQQKEEKEDREANPTPSVAACPDKDPLMPSPIYSHSPLPQPDLLSTTTTTINAPSHTMQESIPGRGTESVAAILDNNPKSPLQPSEEDPIHTNGGTRCRLEDPLSTVLLEDRLDQPHLLAANAAAAADLTLPISPPAAALPQNSHTSPHASVLAGPLSSAPSTGAPAGYTDTNPSRMAGSINTVLNPSPPPSPPPSFPFMDHREFFSSLTAFEAVLVVFRGSFMLLETIMAIVALILSRHATYSIFYFIAIVGHVVLMPLVLIFAPRYFQTTRRVGEEQEQIYAEYRRRRYINTIDIPFLFLLVLGLIAHMSPSDCSIAAPYVYYTNLALVTLGAMYFGAPFLLCGVAIILLPFLYLFTRHLASQNANVFDGRMGATDDIIGAIPIVTYRRKITPESQPQTAITLSSLPKTSANALGSAPLEPISTNLAETAIVVDMPNTSPLDQNRAARINQPASTGTGIGAKIKRRFRLLPNMFRREKLSSSSNSETGDASVPLDPMELDLDDEDALCVICLAEYEDREPLRQLPCGHHFHVECIDEWLHVNAKCPLCVRDLEASPAKRPA
ncbi:hypothetical protein BASA84_001716 [Batrachochytrium salamandrivorans]|nr:hypothetical protein BASA84_001716 [Batrachochytrium salamandrivorans]